MQMKSIMYEWLGKSKNCVLVLNVMVQVALFDGEHEMFLGEGTNKK